MASRPSPFLHPGPVATVDRLSIIHLKRDLQIPIILRDHDDDNEGYTEGKVLNTRFGSFPHTTLIGLPWGTQVRASIVDTGSRGRRVKGQGKKRKRDDSDAPTADDSPSTPLEEKETVAASSGFVHILPPTPENWTTSLPHRTQVVYTPDYSYILQRIRARPGSTLIEAGAGSGSFTHASARAVYSGYPEDEQVNGHGSTKKRKIGKVWSYEFHEQRHEKLEKEILDHGLDGIVQITHRDVCADGFLVDGSSPKANAIFLDLPAPWLALPHLTRSPPPPETLTALNGKVQKEFVSPLDPDAPVHICTFSPCIEQVQRTVSMMRTLGWVNIEMVEIAQRKFEIRRERIGIDNGVQRGILNVPGNVDEALSRLMEVEGLSKTFHERDEKDKPSRENKENPNSRAKIIEGLVEKKLYKEGRLVHRTEPEVKTHTSYLVFAVLPQEWTEEDEQKAREKWPLKEKSNMEEVTHRTKPMSKRAMKKAARAARKEAEGANTEEAPNDENMEESTDMKVENPS
ncbi:adenine-N(1)--methyltransferase-like protein catalytic subunit trm61 [Xylogone sp. PMI_703]|nr:adenine-N(1)--methyltransferase-like protein catalytic subunit trm61 [Xylogone sp. PMI_703]